MEIETQEDIENGQFFRVYGFTVFTAQALEYSLVNLFAVSKLHSEGLSISVRDLMDTRYKQTLGKLILDACDSLGLSGRFCDDLRAALLERNWLIHNFFREYGAVGINPEVRKKVIPRLEQARIIIDKSWESVNEETLRRLQDAGMSEEEIQEKIKTSLDEYFAGFNSKGAT
jgi:hypothetical protein